MDKLKSMFGSAGGAREALKPTREAWFRKVTRLFERSRFDDELWAELEELLISADVGVSTAAKLIEGLRERVERERIKEAEQVRMALRQQILDILNVNGERRFAAAEGLSVVLVVGVNGVGKTTSIAKLAHQLKGQGRKVLLAAADTFRAAAIEQLKLWGERLGIEVIAHQPGSDPAAVVFDAIAAARKRGVDCLIVDTAGRLHTKLNLMEELRKIKRVVTKADVTPEVVLVLDATTGQNGLSQATYFTGAVTVDGILLAKLDSTAKGGIVLAICDQLRIPILFLGTGQEIGDLVAFQADEFVTALLGQ